MSIPTRLRAVAARLRSEEGSTVPLIIFFGAVSLVVVLLVVAASSLYLERKRLFTLADGAALVGAESFDLDSVHKTATGWRPRLFPADVAAAVGSYVGANAGDNFDSLAIDRATTVDSRSATVTLSSYWRPPLVSLLIPEGVRIEVTAVARSVFG